MTKKNKTIQNYCGVCNRSTNHKILEQVVESHREDYSCDIVYQIVECLGCDEKSFRRVFYDIEAAFPNDNDTWDVPEEIKNYPKCLENHREDEDIKYVPDVVVKIYKESILAIKEDAKVLAGLGIRATVEAVCNDRDIKGHNLDSRISKLATEGLISKNDRDRLHGIRFMGNDAAHEIIAPSKEQLDVALKIVEHLMASVYVLEKKAEGKLEVAISKYQTFEELLNSELSKCKSGDEIPIAQIFGAKMRRIRESKNVLECELIRKISNGEYTKLRVGKIDTYKGSSEKIQHFIVN